MFRNQNKFLFLFFAIFVCLIYAKFEDNFHIRFRSVKCSSDNKTIVTNFCYLKAVSRKIVTLNVSLKLLVTYAEPIEGHLIIFYRYGTIFRQIIEIKRHEICSTFFGDDVNPLIKLVVQMIKNKAPNSIHKCPYSGDWSITNFTLDMEILDRATMLFPQGIYRADIAFYLSNSNTFNFTGMAEIKSPLKESFG